MKLLLVIVSIITVIAVDGQEFTVELEGQNLADNEPGIQHFDETDPETTLRNENTTDENDDHDFYSNQSGYNIPRGAGSRCKAKDICIIMGGSCVTNATLCVGRLVPGCKGKNCQCCINGTLEIKVNNLEQRLQTMQTNLTDANSNLNTNIQNLTESNSNLNTKIQNLANDNLNLNARIQNLTDADSNLSTMTQNLSNAYLELSGDIESMKKTLTSMGTKLLILKGGCPVGLFQAAGSKQCYKYVIDTRRDWASAKQKCQEEGLVLAEPTNPVTLMKYIVENYGAYNFGWLAARGAGSYFRWQRSGQQISSSDSLWRPGYAEDRVSSVYCLLLLTHSYYLHNTPNHPFFPDECDDLNFTICEYLWE